MTNLCDVRKYFFYSGFTNFILLLFFFAEELEMLGGPGYEIAQRNMEMMDSMMQEVQEFYENWNRRLDDLTNRHDEEQKLLAKHQK